MGKDKSAALHVESASQDDTDLAKPLASVEGSGKDFDGDVGLSGPEGAVYLIPTPSPDPRGTCSCLVKELSCFSCTKLSFTNRPSQPVPVPEMGKFPIVVTFRFAIPRLMYQPCRCS